MKKLILAAICTVVLASPALAEDIRVEGAWASMMENETERGDIFLTITNKGQAPDRLFAVKTPVAKKVHLETKSETDVLHGEDQAALAFDILPGQPLTLGEDGPHI